MWAPVSITEYYSGDEIWYFYIVKPLDGVTYSASLVFCGRIVGRHSLLPAGRGCAALGARRPVTVVQNN